MTTALGMTLALAGCGEDGENDASAPDSGGAWAAEKAERSDANAALEAELDEAAGLIDDAYDFCIEQITEQLRSPATAQFSERNSEDEGQAADRFLFAGTVDSENGFGALLRSDWACDIHWTSSGFVADTAAVATRG